MDTYVPSSPNSLPVRILQSIRISSLVAVTWWSLLTPHESLGEPRGNFQTDFQNFGTNEGLRHASVEVVKQLPNGTLLIGSQEGLDLFDGYAFKPVPFEKGVLWVNNINVEILPGAAILATRRGLFKYEFLTNSIAPWLNFAHEVNQIEKFGEEIYVASVAGLFIFTQGVWRKVDSLGNAKVSALCFVKDTLWLGTTSGLYTYSNGQIEKQYEGIINTLLHDDGSLWIGTRMRGLVELDLNSMKFDSFPSHQVPSNEIQSLMRTKSGKLWIGTEQGIFVVDRHDEISRFESKPRSQGSLLHNYIESTFEDSSGDIWISTPRGISQYRPNLSAFVSYNSTSVINGFAGDSILSFIQSEDGLVWIGTAEGLAVWNVESSKFRSYDAESLQLNDSKIMTIQEVEGEIYLGTMLGGLMRLSRGHGSELAARTRIDLPSPSISAIETTTDSNLLIAGWDKGLFLLKPTSPSFFDVSELEAFRGKYITDIEIDANSNYWVGTLLSGLYKIDYSQNTTARELPSQIESVIVIELSASSVWIGTNNQGLIQYNPRNKELQIYSTDEGLHSNTIYAIEIDERGLIWASSPKGLSRLNPQTGEITNFNSNHGLQGDDFNAGASLKLADGTLLFGGNNGFNAFDPAEIKLNDYQGQTLITSFSKMNQVQPGRFRSDGSETVELNYKENVFSFEFALMDFAAPEDNTYEYQLVGFDEDWVKAGTRNTVSYTNIDAGDYQFKVRGINNDGLPTDKIASLNLTITPPPWLTWYAYVFYMIALSAALFFAFRLYALRIARLTHEKRNVQERERLEALVAQRTEELNEKIIEQARTLRQKEIANKEIHHRVKNNLQVILGLLTLQAETEENELFRSAMDVIRQRITSMSLIHKSLYEHSVATIDIQQYAENLVGSIRQFHPDVANGNIEVMLDVAKETLDVDTALPVGLVLNELITNCLKHGFADISAGSNLNIIQITFKRADDNFVMTVTDNGAGLPADFDVNSPQSMGSELILIFSQQLDGEITARNEPGGGASFSLTFPVPVNQETVEPELP